MRRNLRLLSIGGMWIAGGLATGSAATGLHAQETIDLPGEDLPLSTDFEPVYRIGSAQATAEWEEFTAITWHWFRRGGEPVPAGWCGLRWRQAKSLSWTLPGAMYRDFGRVGGGPRRISEGNAARCVGGRTQSRW